MKEHIETMVQSIMMDIRHTKMQDMIIYKGPLYERLVAFGFAVAHMAEEAAIAKQQEELQDVTAIVVENYEKEA